MAASIPTAGSQSSSPTISDTDLETVNTEELVMFNSTQTFYTNKEDICVFYTAGNDVDISIKDWVGLFRSGWEATRDFATYRCVQFAPYNVFAPRTRKTIFPQLDIQGLFGDFQFLYVTAEEQVIGVSERFQISDLEPKSDSPVLISDTLLQSLSLISLESLLSSSSDSSQSVDESTFEKVKSASEEALSKAVCDVPVVSSVVSSNDNWSLSDFVIGANSGALCEKLRFPETLDAKSIVDEYEPLKQFYLSLRPRKQALIEEVKEDQSDSAPLSSSQDSKTSALVLYNRPISFPSSSLPSPPTRVLSFSRERFQRSCLEMYRQSLLQSKPEECNPTWVLRISSILEMNDGCQSDNPKHIPPESTQEKDKAQQLAVISFEREEPVENDENCVSNTASKKQKDCTSSGSHKQAEPKQAFNGKKKRSVKTSRTKTNREKQDAMLKEAMTLIATPTSFPPTSPQAQSIPVATTSASTSKAKSPNRLQSRKRTIPTTPGVSKRRRLNGRWSMPALDQCRADDEGYGTTDDEGEQNTEGRSSVERIELLNLALTEELANNADLRLQIRSQQHEAEKCNASSNTAPRSKVDTTIQCATVDTAGKAVNTEKKKKRNAASNTAKVSKKDTQSQCTGTKTTGKATNTEKKEKRHAASNTASVTKKDTPSQCTKAKTAGAATNTAPVPTKKDAEINTPLVHSTDSSVQSHSNKPDIFPAVQSETIQLDVVLRSLASTDPLNSDISLDKWRVVSSKRMLRLRRLIAKKKEEFHRVRENADNYEKRSHTLEAQLTSVRVTLSTETAKRLTAEKELQELRSKFWELLAARSSQPWKSTSNCSQGVLVNLFEQAPAVPALRPVSFLEPVSFKSPEFTPTESASAIQALIPVEFSFKESSENRQLKALPEQKEHTLAIPKGEANEPTSPNKTQIKILLKEEALAKKSEKTFSDLIKSSDTPPLVSTAQFKTVPVSVDRVKKATAGAISFKKFLMPAMTALAETFSSSKPKCKDVNVDENLAGGSTTKGVDGKKSSGAVANVTVSVSAGTPSSKTVHKNDSKCKKTKSSRSKERGRKENCKHPCQETSPDSSSESTIRRQSSAASKSKAKEKVDALRSLPELYEGSTPAQKSLIETDEEKKETSASKRIPDAEARVWHPLTIPLELGAEGGVAEGRGTAPIGMEPIKFCFTHEPKSARKGRPFSYADIAAGKLLREQLASQVVAQAKAEALIELANASSPSDVTLTILQDKSIFDDASDDSSMPPSLPSSPSPPLKFPTPVSTTASTPPPFSTTTTTTPPPFSTTTTTTQTTITTTPPSTTTTPLITTTTTTRPTTTPPPPTTTTRPTTTPPPPTTTTNLWPTTTPPPTSTTTNLWPTTTPPPTTTTTNLWPTTTSPPTSTTTNLWHTTTPPPPTTTTNLWPTTTTTTPPPITIPPRPRQAFLVNHDLAVHRNRMEQHPHLNQRSASRPPRALHDNFMRFFGDTIGNQIRQGKCLTCGMKFSPAVDRYLVEEHIYFHHAFAE